MKPLRKNELSRAKLLLRTPNWIGDAVMCLPALRALRRAFPDAEMVLVARPWVLDLFPVEELRCRTVAYDAHGAHGGVRGRWRIAGALLCISPIKTLQIATFEDIQQRCPLATLMEDEIRAEFDSLR